jgi:hypothetical protein
METESLSGNADVLGEVESEIASLEQKFARLDSLKIEEDRLITAVRSLTAEETRTLGDDAAESVIVKKLIEIRARKDVASVRLASIQDKVKQQTAALAVQGETVRRSFARVLAQVWLVRQARTVAMLNELFDGPIRLQSGRIELKELTRHTLLMKQLKDADNRYCHSFDDAGQETIALRTRTRGWLAELTDLVTSEGSGLVLTVPARQSIEEPRELVEA